MKNQGGRLVKLLQSGRILPRSGEFMTIDEKIRICNAVNTAIAEGLTVKIWNTDLGIMGAIFCDGEIVLIEQDGRIRFHEDKIVAVKQIDVECEVIYDPTPIAKSTAAA